MKNWTLENLKSHLDTRREVKAWIIGQEHVRRRERYFMLDGRALITDQDRDVHSQDITLKLFVRLPDSSGRQGEISKRLFPAIPLGPQLESAIESALQTDHQSWELPAQVPSDLPELLTADPRMAEDLESVMSELTGRIGKQVSLESRSRFNSAELFLSIHDRELHLSNGLIHRASQSRIYTEAAYSFEKDGRSDEYLSTRWAVTLDELPIERIFEETSDRAEHSLAVTKPRTGKYPVIVDSEVLATLFMNHLARLSSANAYHDLPFVKPGEELVPGATGDLLTLALDPSLEFGADTVAVSEQGVRQSPSRLVEKNRVVATATDQRYSHYLFLPATPTRGNVVVDPGTATHQEMTRHAPQVIEILQFSGLFADPNSGTFSSEIRLAKLYDNERGEVRYLKGGSLSGSFTENFRGARLSRERTKRSVFSANNPRGEGYFGPEHALLSDVSIVG